MKLFVRQLVGTNSEVLQRRVSHNHPATNHLRLKVVDRERREQPAAQCGMVTKVCFTSLPQHRASWSSDKSSLAATKPVGSMVKMVKAPFLQQLYDHDTIV